MQTKLLILLAIAFTSTQAIFKCNETNPYQYSCYTIEYYDESPKNVYDVARQQHVNPVKLAEYNQVDLTHEFSVGESIIVPLDQCTPQLGQWGCYTVKSGDTLYNIAMNSDETTYRNAQALIDLNEDILWGNSHAIYEGMDLRMPVHIVPITWETTTQEISYSFYQNITYIAGLYATTEHDLLVLNEAILSWNSSLNIGMTLAVPKPAEQVNTPSPCVDGTYWECVTAVSNDSLWKIGNAKKVNDQLICELNEIANCSYITVGQVIAVPKIVENQWGTQCTDETAVWECKSTSYSWNCDGFECQFPITYAYNAYYSTSMDNWNEDLQMLVSYYNQDRLPKSKDHQYFFGDTPIRIPFTRCTPGFNYTCIPQGSKHVSEFQGSYYGGAQDWFSPMMLYSNWNQGWVPNCQLTDANDYNMIRVPRQSPPVQPTIYYKPEGCENALYTPTCVSTPGENTCYKVGGGETVYSIAQQFNLEWQALCQYNGMDNNCSCLFTEDVYLSIPSAPQTLLEV